MTVLGGDAFPYERGTPVQGFLDRKEPRASLDVLLTSTGFQAKLEHWGGTCPTPCSVGLYGVWKSPLQGYLAHNKSPPPLGPPQGPRHMPAVGS